MLLSELWKERGVAESCAAWHHHDDVILTHGRKLLVCHLEDLPSARAGGLGKTSRFVYALLWAPPDLSSVPLVCPQVAFFRFSKCRQLVLNEL